MSSRNESPAAERPDPSRAKPAPDPVGLFRQRMAKTVQRLQTKVDIGFASNPFRALRARFVIATGGGRVGSHLLCQGLLNHGGNVKEYLNPNRIFQKCVGEGASLEVYCEQTLRKFAANGVFGVKGNPNILAPLALAGEFPEFRAEWKFVYLRRLNVVKQAISQLKAELTGAWQSSKEPDRELGDMDFDGTRISTVIEGNQEANATWEEIFELFEIKPLRLTYEDLAIDSAAAALRTAEFLALDEPAIKAKSWLPLQPQADALSDRWEQRFREEHAAFCLEKEAPVA